MMGLARCVAHYARTVRHQSITSTRSFWKLNQAPPYWKEFAQHLISFNAYLFLSSETKRLALTTNDLKSTLGHMQYLYNERARRYCICVAENVENMYQSYIGPVSLPDDEEPTELRDSYLSGARQRFRKVRHSEPYDPRWVEQQWPIPITRRAGTRGGSQLLNIPKAIGEDMFDAEDGIQEETTTSERATGGQEEAHECRASFDDWDGTEVEITEVEEVEVAEGNDAETVDGDESGGSDGSDGRSIT